ncbi:MAG: RiPP maturation radical SAM C-methyltransferase [Desulfobacterales bacterium]|nr:RiPP maturation radical SAM C-methyltransferase [Desulfobacterales bacterium]MDX2512286.1 RiPP maturation radical SAM C-methyltransferase [Desulfobacterales bacterium]
MTKKQFKHICLISLPWPLFKRPSIQLGSLKSFLNKELEDTRVDTSHMYLNVAHAIGYDVYQAISRRTWLAESVYAALLYPERSVSIERLFREQASRDQVLRSVDFQALLGRVKDSTDEAIQQINWHGIGLVGISVCLCQLTSSLYAARQIKKISPDIITLFGGSTVSNPFCKNYLDVFTDIDVIVNGEGELPLLQLMSHLEKHGNIETAHTIEGVVTRETPDNELHSFSQLPDLECLATPDYDDYFQTLETFSPGKRFFPTLPVESSRGCWWKGETRRNQPGGCAFCNLNLQWNGYRKRHSSELVHDIDVLTERHQTLSVAFMDNVLPAESPDRLFTGLSRLNKDLKMFSEIRASTPLKTLARMHSAGMAEVQVGIEALSSKLLKKMDKGITAIQNMEIMKNCEALGLQNVSNLIIHFPGSDETDVMETLQNMVFAMPFRPLKPVNFWLGLGSSVWENPARFHIKSISNHPYYRILLPEHITKNIQFSIQAYRGDLVLQKKRWKPVKKKIQEWNQFYADLHSRPSSGPILGYQDGGRFLILRQRQLNADPMQHRLVGTSRKIYLFCSKVRSLRRLLLQFPELPEDKLMPFLRMMTGKGLMFEEQERYLSLAVRIYDRR